MFDAIALDPLSAGAVPKMLAIGPNVSSDRLADQAAVLARTRIVDRVRYADAVERLAAVVAPDIVLLDAADAPPEQLDMLLSAVRSTMAASDLCAVITFAPHQLDHVAAQTEGDRVQLLCDPTMGERVTAISLSGRSDISFHDSVREREDDRLRRLNDEVARIADTLAQLSRGVGERGERASPREPAPTFSPPPLIQAEDTIDPADIRNAIRARRLRGQFIDMDLFADPAWDMLLDLFAARLEHNAVSVSSLCIAAAVPATTALRWIATMTEAGLFERRCDPHDRRRAYVVLTSRAAESMQRYFAAVRAAGLSIA